jgi:type II secretory pathway component GspD/PulD (secretin)
MSRKNINIGRLLCGLSLTFATTLVVTQTSAQNIEVKAYKERLSNVLDTIGEQSKKKIVLNTDQNPLMSFGSKEASLGETLKKIENLYGFQFEVTKDEIIVTEKAVAKTDKNKRSLASTDPSTATPQELRADGYRYRTVNMNFQTPGKVVERVKKIVGEDVKFIDIDEKNNAIVFYGDEEVYKLVRQIVDDLDVAAPQILLSTRLVEVSKTFAREFGVKLQRKSSGDSGYISSPNQGVGDKFLADYKFGIIDSAGLAASIAASESKGDVKTISNPQVMTSDDISANLTSDKTIAVRVAASSSSTGASAATNVEKITAGLKLDVTPKVLRDGKIRLKVQVDNGVFDQDFKVDAIPSVANTGIKAEMVLRTGQTAAIAGLYKNSSTDGNAGVPLAMNIPLFGWLFKSQSKSSTRSEMMAFITPSIVEIPSERQIDLEKSNANKDETRSPASR